MKQFWTILQFELKSYFKNKIFIGVTLFLVALIGIVMLFPRFPALADIQAPAELSERPVMLVSAGRAKDPAAVERAFAAAFSGYEVRGTAEPADWIREAVVSGAAECAFFIESADAYIYYVNDLSMYDTNTAVADEVLQNLYRVEAMIDGGIGAGEAERILSTQITHTITNLGRDQMQNFFYTYILIFALYMVILLYGQMVATNVATEKSSRAMELLITSAKPVSMMFGKVVGSCLAGLFQLVAIFGSAYLLFNGNRTYWENNSIVVSIFDVPLSLFAYMFAFFILGFFLYAFLYGAIGSTATKVEDVNTSVMPVTLLFIIALFVVVFSMTSGYVDNTLMQICSYLSFTSPMAMFARIAMSTVPFYEIVISVGILILAVFGVGILSAKIYRVGVLLYGTAPRIGAIMKAVRKA